MSDNTDRKLRILKEHRGVILAALREKHSLRAGKIAEEIADLLGSRYAGEPSGAVALAMNYLTDNLIMDIIEFTSDGALHQIN